MGPAGIFKTNSFQTIIVSKSNEQTTYIYLIYVNVILFEY
jgi:hypothetical protein